MVKTAKVRKPRPDFPLFPHATGRWAKKVRGKLRYFGKCQDDVDGQKALALWLDQRDELLAGRTPRPKRDGLTVAKLANDFLAAKEAMLNSGELSPRTFEEYLKTCQRIADVFGRDRLVDDLRPDDFQAMRARMATLWGPIAIGNEVQRVRCVFRYGVDNGLIQKVVLFGSGFKKPSQKTLRLARAKAGPRVFEAADLRLLIQEASVNMRAMLLLGINGGLGNTDLGCLPIGAVDVDGGWLNYPRPKTGITRRIPLWCETLDAIRLVLAHRREPLDPNEAHLLLISARGNSYVGDHRGYRVTEEMRAVCRKAKVKGRTFYDLRRTFQTIADGAKDPIATSAIMGHVAASGDMSAVYRQRIGDDRLVAVVNYVRTWLFGEQGTK